MEPNPNILMLCLQFGVISVGASSWTAEVPSRVSGLVGSCVVIPCRFDYPPDPRNPQSSSDLTGIWAEESHHVVYHPDPSKVIQRYRNRTSLLGQLREKQCSLKVDPLDQADTGPFHFRIEIKDHDKFSYWQSQVSITLESSPRPMWFSVREEVKVGENVSAVCSVSHSCPSDPPVFTWSRPGPAHLRSAGLPDGQWNATSSLTFEATPEDHQRPLGCTVTYRGGQTQRSPPTVLRVKYPPVNVRVSYTDGVAEGEDVSLRCSSVANPPAHSYRWFDSLSGALCHTGHAYTLRRVSRHTGPVFCTATNTEGNGTSDTVHLNVLYPPEIKTGSTCSSDSVKAVACVCIVESRPAATIRWSLTNGRQAPPTGGELEPHGVVSIGTLRVPHGAPGPALCHAHNSQGNATLTLAFPSDDHALMLYVAVAIGVLFVVVVTFLTALGVSKKCRRSSGDQQTSSMQDMNETKPTASRKETVTDSIVFCNVYTNDQLYGNMEPEDDNDTYDCAMDDDAIYANV